MRITEHKKLFVRELLKRDDVLITGQDKGNGVVVLNKADYIDKMMNILPETSKI